MTTARQTMANVQQLPHPSKTLTGQLKRVSSVYPAMASSTPETKAAQLSVSEVMKCLFTDILVFTPGEHAVYCSKCAEY
jgi:hypothetical protein